MNNQLIIEKKPKDITLNYTYKRYVDNRIPFNECNMLTYNIRKI